MSNGENLLALQEIDIELARLKAELSQLPELKDLAKKRRALAAANEELFKVRAQRKDAETDLADLAEEEADYRARVEKAQERAGATTEYRDIQNIEIELTNLAKWLDKVAFDQKEAADRLEALTVREEQGRDFIAKLERAIVKSGARARSVAEDIQKAIADGEERRGSVEARLPEAMKAAYEAAAKQFRGLGVEKLEADTPSLCRMKLTEASIDEVQHAPSGVTTCPYCHRILVVKTGGNA